jgi:thymidylate synthase (FAD)
MKSPKLGNPLIAGGARLYLVSRPALSPENIQRFLADEGTSWRRSTGATAAEEVVELGGRLCYMSFGTNQSPKTTGDYIANLISLGHESVLEHATWTILVTGVSRAFSHQLVRHRVGFAFSQLSQQYHDETDAKFVMPEYLRGHPRAIAIWSELVDRSRYGYKAIQKEIDISSKELGAKENRRAVRSAARSVLTNSTETKILLTVNARAIRHFLEVRGSIPGDIEMRRVSALLLELMRAEAPRIFDDFELTNLSDGSPSVHLKKN